VVALVDESNGELGSDWEVGVRCGVEDDLGEDIMRFGCTYFVTSWLFSHPPPPLRTTPMSLAKNPLRIFGFSSRKKEEERLGRKKKKRAMDQERPISFFLSLESLFSFPCADSPPPNSPGFIPHTKSYHLYTKTTTFHTITKNTNRPNQQHHNTDSCLVSRSSNHPSIVLL